MRRRQVHSPGSPLDGAITANQRTKNKSRSEAQTGPYRTHCGTEGVVDSLIGTLLFKIQQTRRARRRQAPGVLFPRREKGPCCTRLSESKRDSDLNCKGGGHEIGTFCKNTDFRSFRRQNNNNKLSSDSGISSPVFACFFVVPRFSRSWRFAGHRGIDPGMFHVEHAGNRSHHGFRYRQQVPLTRLRKARLCHASSP